MRLHRIRYEWDGLLLRRSAGPVAMRRGERDRNLPAGRRRLSRLDPHVAGCVSEDDARAVRRVWLRIYSQAFRAALEAPWHGPAHDRPHPDRESATGFLRGAPGALTGEDENGGR